MYCLGYAWCGTLAAGCSRSKMLGSLALRASQPSRLGAFYPHADTVTTCACWAQHRLAVWPPSAAQPQTPCKHHHTPRKQYHTTMQQCLVSTSTYADSGTHTGVLSAQLGIKQSVTAPYTQGCQEYTVSQRSASAFAAGPAMMEHHTGACFPAASRQEERPQLLLQEPTSSISSFQACQTAPYASSAA